MLASISKTITCAGIMALVEDGRLDLDTDVNEYLPFEVHVPKTPDVRSRCGMLLTHTSAIRDRTRFWGTPSSDPTLYFHATRRFRSVRSSGSTSRSAGVGTRSRGTSTSDPGDEVRVLEPGVALSGYVAEVVSGRSTSTSGACAASSGRWR
jgi:CubicO group peptidase (beta-lactamase class C family)